MLNGWKHTALTLAALLCARTAFAQQVPAPRFAVNLAADWKFLKNAPPGAETADDQSWETVSVPHTWNAKDGQDGGNNYFRGECVYRHPFNILSDQTGRTSYLRFEGVNQRCTISINGKEVAKHAGGNAGFTIDISDAAHPGQNELAVRVTNTEDQSVPPWNADFTFFGGIYRPVQLLSLDPVHISPLDFGSPGVYITTDNVTKTQANLTLRTLVRNTAPAAATRVLETTIIDAAGQTISTQRNAVTVDPGKTETVSTPLLIANPHLWNGRKDPYLYTARVRLLQDGKVLDEVIQHLGIRTTAVDPVKGFLLNGQPYDLHGVNRHQDRPDKGWAISDADHAEDIALIKEMGCTAVRLAHYQHAQAFYDLCDKEGLVVWAEVPVVNKLGASPAFFENWKQQYTELIRQNMNHPSIAFWSAGNEVDPPQSDRPDNNVYNAFRDIAKIAKAEDPSRLSASAWRERFYPPADMTDVFGLNAYLGWYDRDFKELESYIADHSKGPVKGKWAMTEYGAGASIYYHSENPVRMDHSEEYQCLCHEQYWKVLSAHPEVWGKFIWNFADFAVDNRKEGDHAGRNDKGLVTYDRKTKKDAFYFYKANWSDQPTLHINSSRFSVRGADHIPVKIYSNSPELWLWVNGTLLRSQKSEGFGIFNFQNVPLQPGPNHLLAADAPDKSNIRQEDHCDFTYTPGAPAEVDIPQDETMAAELKKGPPRAPAR
jgi:beta-galactosidase